VRTSTFAPRFSLSASAMISCLDLGLDDDLPGIPPAPV
jgi:hypothetical protein